jgi:hypothetical protein
MSEYKLNLSPSPTGETSFRTGEAPKIFQYRGFGYKTYSTDSFCRLLKAKATSIAQAVVFENDSGFSAIVDTSVEDRPQDEISYAFNFSVHAIEWELILKEKRIFSVKDMVNFLKRREQNEIEDIEKFMGAAQNFKYAVKTEGDFTRADSQNYTFAIKVGEAEGTVKVPDRIYANLALIEGSEFVQTIEIEVDIHRPKDEKDGAPGFMLSCPKYPCYWQRAFEYEATEMERELSEFLVVKGAAH